LRWLDCNDDEICVNELVESITDAELDMLNQYLAGNDDLIADLVSGG